MLPRVSLPLLSDVGMHNEACELTTYWNYLYSFFSRSDDLWKVDKL